VAVKYKLADDAVELVLHTAVRHVFEGNFRCAIEEIAAISREDLLLSERSALTSQYVRIYGDFNGILCMQMPRDLLGRIAKETLGWDVFKEETFAGDAILRDASGEIVNMMAGTYKNMISRVKLNCRLLPPASFDDEGELVMRTLSATGRWLCTLRIGGELTQIILLGVKA